MPVSSYAAATLPSLTGLKVLKPVRLTTADGVDAGPAAGHSLNVPQGWSAEVWASVPGDVNRQPLLILTRGVGCAVLMGVGVRASKGSAAGGEK